ncbi:protein transport protein Sec24A [Agrilus planipennis]|uniref:Protein transport protein Sec24A n=1 Tax=Agrilus planipennis TaxID=224129 RepID=A0A1W4WSS3_AGRPL|nr:protein transport protein Sec24A [Agrilus planipennis]
MSRLNTNQPLPNGIPPQMDGILKQDVLPSALNGLGSSSTSRGSSPGIMQIPASQLPPRTSIPLSQLPPVRNQNPNINNLAQNYSKLSVTATCMQQVTPSGSPKPTFSTSTPVGVDLKNDGNLKSDGPSKFNSNSAFSPISTVSSKQSSLKLENIEADDNFKNVPLNNNSENANYVPTINSKTAEGLQTKDKQNSNNENTHKEIYSGFQVLEQKVIPTSSQSIFPIDGNKLKFPSNPPGVQASSGQNFSFASRDVPTQSSSSFNKNIQPILLPSASVPPNSFLPQTIISSPNQPPPVKTQQWTPGYTEPLASSRNAIQSQAVPFMTVIPPQNLHSNANISTGNISYNSVLPPVSKIQGTMSIPAGMQQSSVIPPRSLQQNSLPSQNIFPINSQQNALPSFSPTQQISSVPQMQSRYQSRPNRYPTQVGQKISDTNYPVPPPGQPLQPNFTSHLEPAQNIPIPLNSNAPASQAKFNYNTPPTQYNQQRVPISQNYPSLSITQGFNKLWGHENVDLLQTPNILPQTKIEPPKVSLGQDFLDAANCSPDIFRCTITKIPESNSLLQKSRLPFGILIHPFKDLEHLPVIQCSTIVRCRACRTYINPFVFFVDAKRWKCNLCYRLNELPEEFQYDPVSKTYGDPSRRPEIKSSTIEYIAPSEYMLRPPQPAVYLFLIDVSKAAVDSGYLQTLCTVLASNLSSLPGDARTQIGVLAYNSALHFYSLADGLNQPHEMTVLDIDDVFLPCPDNLLVNLSERKELILDLLTQLPNRFKNSYDSHSALGAALQAAHKLIGPTGGRVTVFQAALPNKGPGALSPREDPNKRSAADVQHLNPANDFYKRLALECSGQQIAVDLFIINSQYIDLATISGISRFSGGSIYHFPLFNVSRLVDNEKFERCLKRYLTRKIGFEAVMRIRCTRGLTIHTFHGNFFVRSTDLLSLPNVNPDAGFGMQIAIEESLSELQTVCFQAALLYTSSKGERRIRVHTLCIPVASTLTDIINSADQQCIVGLLSKMAVDRSLQSSLSDAREAFLNVAIDVLASYRLSLNVDNNSSGLLAPNCLKLLPLYISALLKHPAFRTGTATRLDDRIKAMCDMKSLPLYLLIQQIYPDLYPVHNLEEQEVTKNQEGEEVPQPLRLQLSARSLDSKGAYLMDQGDSMILYIGPSISIDFLASIFGVSDYNAISDEICELPLWDNPRSQRLNMFINYLNDEKPFPVVLQVIKDNSPNRHLFIERLLEDRVENALSYHEFLQHLKTQVK